MGSRRPNVDEISILQPVELSRIYPWSKECRAGNESARHEEISIKKQGTVTSYFFFLGALFMRLR
jgi:hypothetical protein